MEILKIWKHVYSENIPLVQVIDSRSLGASTLTEVVELITGVDF